MTKTLTPEKGNPGRWTPGFYSYRVFCNTSFFLAKGRVTLAGFKIMVKSYVHIRLENTKKDQLILLAKQQQKKYTDLMREKIDELLLNGVSWDVKQRVKKIVAELRGPFAYVKTPIGKKRARHERKIRDVIAKELEEAFKI